MGEIVSDTNFLRQAPSLAWLHGAHQPSAQNTPMKRTTTIHLADHRKHRNLTQEGLAELMGYSRARIAQAESGPENLTLAFLNAAAAALDVSVASLFSPPDELNDEAQDLIEDYLAIPDKEARKELRQIVKRVSERESSSIGGDTAPSIHRPRRSRKRPTKSSATVAG